MTINRSADVWLVRGLLAAFFFFGSDIIIWTNPLDHSVLDWIVRGVGYVLIATLTLDIAQRYRIQDGFDAMVVLAGTALVFNLVINPALGWAQIPDTLLTRIIGSDALVQLILWGIFLSWMRGDVRKYRWQAAIGAMWLGIYWGFWMRWTPELRGSFPSVPLVQLYALAGITFALIAIFYLVLVVPIAPKLKADAFLLSPLEWALAAMGLIALLLIQAITGAITGAAFFITVVVLLLIWGILWLRHDPDEATILDKHFPIAMQPPIWIYVLIAAFTGAFTLAYHTPLFTVFGYVNQLWLMEVGSAGMGILWLPIVASVIATRAIDYAMREGFTF